MKKVIGVVFGGKSVEHEISIISALQAIENMDGKKYDIVPIYIDKKGTWFSDDRFLTIDVFKNMDNFTKKFKPVNLVKKTNNEFYLKNTKSSLFTKGQKIDFIFEIVHGTNVEDGTLSGYLKTIGIPFIGPTVLSGAIGQDKVIAKDLLKANNIKQTKYLWFLKNEEINTIICQVNENLQFPLIIKPANLGSSIAISIANNNDELIENIKNAFTYDNKIVVEECLVEFKEINISVLGSTNDKCRVSITEMVGKNKDFLSYDDKYVTGNKKTTSSGMESLTRVMPAPIDKELIIKIEEIAKKTHRILNCHGVIRIDLMIIDNDIYLNEVNNIPGSLSYYLWEKTGLEYSELIDELINIGINYHFKQEKMIQSISTNVLSLNKKGGK